MYDQESLGVDLNYIRQKTKEVWERENEKYDHCIFVVDPLNWKDGLTGTGGWNLGTFYNNYSVELVKLTFSDEWLYKIFGMEIAHSLNDFAFKELGVNFESLSGVNFDYGIVHGEHPDWGILHPDGKYFTDFNYTKLIAYFAPYIKQFYFLRKNRFEKFVNNLKQQISLFEQVAILYRKLILSFAKPTAVYENDLEESKGRHEHN